MFHSNLYGSVSFDGQVKWDSFITCLQNHGITITCQICQRGGRNFARGIFRTRKFHAGCISHSGLKIEREISHLPGLSTVRASVLGGPSLVKKFITRALHGDLKPKVCVFFLEASPESMLPITTV